MQEREISQNEAAEIVALWQREGSPVEVLVRFSQGLMQAHPGQVTLEPDLRVVIAYVADKDHYFTTIVDMTGFESVRLIESESAITFVDPIGSDQTFDSVTIACRKKGLL